MFCFPQKTHHNISKEQLAVGWLDWVETVQFAADKEGKFTPKEKKLRTFKV